MTPALTGQSEQSPAYAASAASRPRVPLHPGRRIPLGALIVPTRKLRHAA